MQQERHIKLWFAGQAGNWPLADYEIGELNDGFEMSASSSAAILVKQHVGGPLAALQKAVDGKNAPLPAAFDKLSAGCNACHHTLDHGFIVIQRPTCCPTAISLRAAEVSARLLQLCIKALVVERAGNRRKFLAKLRVCAAMAWASSASCRPCFQDSEVIGTAGLLPAPRS